MMTRTNQDPKPKSRRRKWRGRITRLANAERAENHAQYYSNLLPMVPHPPKESPAWFCQILPVGLVREEVLFRLALCCCSQICKGVC